MISPGQQRATRAALRSPEPSHTGQHTPLAQRTSLPIPIPARATDSGSEVAIRLLPACCDIRFFTSGSMAAVHAAVPDAAMIFPWKDPCVVEVSTHV